MFNKENSQQTSIVPDSEKDSYSLETPENPLWQNFVQNMITRMKDHGYYYEIEEEGPPYKHVQFGFFCELMIQDDAGKQYELKIYRYHYPRDPGQTEIIQIYEQGNNALCIDIIFRSNEGPLHGSKPHLVIQIRSMTRNFHQLTPDEQQQELIKLANAKTNIEETQRLFEELQNRGEKVIWIQNETTETNLRFHS